MENKYKIKSLKLPGHDYWTPDYNQPNHGEIGFIATGEWQTIGGVYPQTKEEADIIAKNLLIEKKNIPIEDII
jgi:hypothetical protein